MDYLLVEKDLLRANVSLFQAWLNIIIFLLEYDSLLKEGAASALVGITVY